MAHDQQRQFFEWLKGCYPQHFHQTSVLEMGSLNINGSVRDFFENPVEYVGIDLGAGPGVDVVCEAQEYQHEHQEFDTSVSAECFEHNPFWMDTFINMYEHTRVGGLVTFTCATTGRHEHGTSRTSPTDSPYTVQAGWDYYKNLEEQDFVAVLDFDMMFSEWSFSTNESSKDLYFYGIKRQAEDAS